MCTIDLESSIVAKYSAVEWVADWEPNIVKDSSYYMSFTITVFLVRQLVGFMYNLLRLSLQRITRHQLVGLSGTVTPHSTFVGKFVPSVSIMVVLRCCSSEMLLQVYDKGRSLCRWYDSRAPLRIFCKLYVLQMRLRAFTVELLQSAGQPSR